MPFILIENPYDGEIQRVSDVAFSSVSLPIGYESHGETDYSAVVQLHDEGRGMEFFFAIASWGPYGECGLIIDSMEIKELLPSECKQKVASVFNYIAWELIHDTKPEQFCMVAITPDINNKLYAKYDRMLGVFGSCKYDCSAEEMSDGCWRWMMTKASRFGG